MISREWVGSYSLLLTLTTYQGGIIKRKPFNKDNHAANDPAGKEVVINYLRSKGVPAIENPDDYGVDIMIPGSEVERRTVYTKTWPYPTFHVPERKTKFLKLDITYDVVVHHVLPAGEFDTLYRCKSSVIRDHPLVEVPNNSMPEGEYFYDVPVGEWEVAFTTIPNIWD